MRRRRAAAARHARLSLASLLAAAGLGLAPAASAEEAPTAVVVAVGDVELGPAFAGASKAGGASWRSAELRPRRTPRPAPPTAALDRIEGLYAEADFLRCLAAVQAPVVDVATLLAAGHRPEAARAAVFAAGCAHGAGDLDLARELARRLVVLDLPAQEALGRTTPEFQALAEEADREVRGQGLVSVRLVTRPAGARVRVDGGAAGCDEAPCTAELRPGEHVVTAEALGHLPRRLELQVSEAGDRQISLDGAPSDVQRLQLADALARGARPDSPEVTAAMAEAFGARVVLVAYRRRGQVRLALWDRALERVVARQTAEGSEESQRLAAFAAVREWRGVAEPTPLVRRPVFWISLVAVAAAVATAVGVGVWAATRPVDVQHDLVFE